MTRSRQRTRQKVKGNPAQINRPNRRLLHELWPKLIAGPVGGVGSAINYYLRTRGDGLTPGEIRLLEKQEEKLNEVHKELMTIFFRLKK
jgi:hypothetical protein